MIAPTLALFILSSVTVKVSPQNLYMEPGGEARLSLEVYQGQSEVSPQWVRWKVIPEFLGKVKDGKVLALREGTGVVRATCKTKRGLGVGFAYLEVKSAKNTLRVRIEPNKIHLLPDDSQRLFLKAQLLGSAVKVDRVDWRVIPSWLGEVTEEGVLKVGERIGAGKVVALAKKGEQEAFSSVPLVVGRPEEFPLKVSVSPGFAVVPMGEKIQFEGNVLGLSESKSDSVEFEWWLDPPEIGKLRDGEFLGLKPGRGTVWAMATYQKEVGLGKSLVLVRENFPGRFDIPPRDLVLYPGEKVDIPIRPPLGERFHRLVNLAVSPPKLGEVSISEEEPSLTLEAGEKPGMGFIELKGIRRLLHRLPLLVGENHLDIEPEEITVTPGEPIKFHLNFKGEKELPVRWEVIPEIGGDIKGDGTFVASGATKRVYVLAVIDPKRGGGGAIAQVNVIRTPEIRRRIKEGMRWKP